MKILLLIPSLRSGGVETGTIDLSCSLKQLGHEVIIASSGGQLVSALANNHIKHIQLPIHKKSIVTFSQVGRLAKLILQERVDVVHAQSRVPAWVAYYACKKTKTPFITSCHGYYSAHFLSSIMGKGKRVIVISKVIAEHMHKAFGVPYEKIRLVYRGVDLNTYEFRKGKLIENNKIIRIVNIGRLTPLKGQDVFIKAISILEKKIPSLEAWIVGSGDKPHYEHELKELVKALHLENKIKFLGRRIDIAHILSQADVLVLSTQTPEAFGRVIIEAGAAGVPVCASRIGGIVEIIDDGSDGILFDNHNEQAIAAAIARMIENPDFAQQCRSNLRKKVEARFSLMRMTQETVNVYQEVLKKKNILVIKLGGLGDVILSVPTVRALRNYFRNAHISLLIDERFEQVVKDCPYFDELILLRSQRKKRIQLVQKLRKQNFDMSIDLKNSDFSHVLAFAAGIRHRYGFTKGFLSMLLNHSVSISQRSNEAPVAQQKRFLETMGIGDFDASLELWVSPLDKQNMENRLHNKKTDLRHTLVGIVLGASKNWPTKNWPLKHIAALIERLHYENIQVVLLGEHYMQKDAVELRKYANVIDFVGQTTIPQFVALIKRLSVLVTPDSAALHVGAAFKVPIIAIFGPTHPDRHIPPVNTIDICFKAVECQPCYLRSCTHKTKLQCLEEISVDEIYSLLKKKLNTQVSH